MSGQPDRSLGGRPSLSDGPTARIALRVPETLKRRLEASAALLDVDLSTYVRDLLTAAVTPDTD